MADEGLRFLTRPLLTHGHTVLDVYFVGRSVYSNRNTLQIMRAISDTERCLWYKMALVNLKQAVLQVGAGRGVKPEDVIKDYRGYDFDAWIPHFKDDAPEFDEFLWNMAREHEVQYEQNGVSCAMLNYWHIYEATIRGWSSALNGGTPGIPEVRKAWCDLVMAIANSQE